MIDQICWLISHYYVYYMHVIFTIDHIQQKWHEGEKKGIIIKVTLEEGIKREIKMSPSK